MAGFAVIYPGAGRSERFGGGESKVLAKLDGRPVFLHTLESFASRSDVVQQILVVSAEDHEKIKMSFGPNLAFMNVRLVLGGKRRRDSVANGLEALAENAEFIAIHDAVRPCVTTAMIDAVFAAAVRHGAAILAAPVTGTLKRLEQGNVAATVDRSGLFEAQTPQVFRRDWLLEAYAALRDEVEVTDEAQALEGLGKPVRVVESDRSNLKITTAGDVSLASAILKSRPAKKAGKLGAFEEAKW